MQDTIQIGDRCDFHAGLVLDLFGNATLTDHATFFNPFTTSLSGDQAFVLDTISVQLLEMDFTQNNHARR